MNGAVAISNGYGHRENLSELYSFTEVGTYTVQATIFLADQRGNLVSPPIQLNVEQ
jgi:hypothetical protein